MWVKKMARKEVISKNDLLRCAFELAREEGIAEVTARKLAARAGCSTQPIFRAYANMDELLTRIMEQAIAYFDSFYTNAPSNHDETPFLKLGLTYISFAKQEKNLFQMMFLSKDRNGRSLYELINGKNGNVLHEINRAKEDGCRDPEDLFMKMWIFIHGAACMAITGDYDLGEKETVSLLVGAYRSFREQSGLN